MAERRFRVVGDIDLAGASTLRSKLLVLVNATDDDLLLDCTELQFIDSQGIRVFIDVQRLLTMQGRGFRVVNLNGMARRAFDVLGLIELLDIDVPEPA